VMAVRASDFDALGGFDERFALYFEETDFLRRVAAARKRVAYVPAARCRHIYNQSASQTGGLAATSYAESERKYLEKWNGPLLARALKKLERPVHVEEPPLHRGPIALDRDGLVIEVSPLASFATAAGHFPRGRAVELPNEVRRSMGETPFYLRIVEAGTAQVLSTVRISP